jgi:hypothetical protein
MIQSVLKPLLPFLRGPPVICFDTSGQIVDGRLVPAVNWLPFLYTVMFGFDTPEELAGI